MAVVRYVVLSDLHLGDRDSLFTSLDPDGSVDPTAASPVLTAVADVLRTVAQANGAAGPPTLILNGDIVELAFGSVAGALNTFQRLGEEVLRPGGEACDRILYLPGNHDHHLWEMARETQYRMNLAEGDHERGDLPAPQHVTPLDPVAAVPSMLLNTVLRQVEHDAHEEDGHVHDVRILYPNMALVDPALDRGVLLHHGHYVEPLYHFFSRLRRLFFPDRPPPETVADIEAENFAWIDFVWSLFGRSGGAGEDVERVFDDLRYPERTRELALGLADRVAPLVKMPYLSMTWMRRFILKKIFMNVAKLASTERNKLQVVLSDRTRAGIRSYLFGPAIRQFREEIGPCPTSMAFVFGHTHKPFELVMEGDGSGGPVEVYNSGGWVVDTLSPDPAFGGALVLIGEELEVASVRVFNDGSDRDYRAAVRSPESMGPPSAFATRIQSLIDASRASPDGPWEVLERTLRHEVRVRRAHILERR